MHNISYLCRYILLFILYELQGRQHFSKYCFQMSHLFHCQLQFFFTCSLFFFNLFSSLTMPFSEPRLLHACFCLFTAFCPFTPTLISFRHLQVLCASVGRSVGGSAAETLMVLDDTGGSVGLAGTFPAPSSAARVPEMEDGATCLQADGTFER